MTSFKLKLVIDKRENRVLFAESDKEFVDFVFNILSLPLGTVIRILYKADETCGSAIPGCLGGLYEGVNNLNYLYMDRTAKECLLNPRAPFRGTASLGLLPEASLARLRIPYVCSKTSLSGGYVKSPGMFVVSDDLVVQPMTTDYVFSLLHPKGRTLDNTENREVNFSGVEAQKLLGASLQSKTALTDTFLKGNGAVKTEP